MKALIQGLESILYRTVDRESRMSIGVDALT